MNDKDFDTEEPEEIEEPEEYEEEEVRSEGTVYNQPNENDGNSITDNIYRILLDGNWRLEDLYEFPHAFNQVYSFVYCLDSDLDSRDSDRINHAMASYPWRGGYSYVNIYSVLYNQIPKPFQPKIASIHKASPGWLDLLLNIEVAKTIAASVGILSGGMVAAAKTYSMIYKTILEINEHREKHNLKMMEITTSQLAQVDKCSKLLAKNLGFSKLQDLDDRTGNHEISLRLLMAHYRRLKILADYVLTGKAYFPVTKTENNND